MEHSSSTSSSQPNYALASVHGAFALLWIGCAIYLLTGGTVVLPSKRGESLVLDGSSEWSIYPIAGLLVYFLASAMMIYIHIRHNAKWRALWRVYVSISMVGILLVVIPTLKQTGFL